MRFERRITIGLASLFVLASFSNLSLAGEDGDDPNPSVSISSTTPATAAPVDSGAVSSSSTPAATSSPEDNKPKEGYFKYVLFKGLGDSTIAPGLEKANEDLADAAKEQCSRSGQSCGVWTWHEIRDLPHDMHESAKEAYHELKQAVSRPIEICREETPAACQAIEEEALAEARRQTNPLQQRLTLLSGKVHSAMLKAAKDGIQAPVVGVYHAVSGVLYLPFASSWKAFKIGVGTTGTVLYNVLNPIGHGVAYCAKVTGSTLAATGVAAADALCPSLNVPPAIGGEANSNTSVRHNMPYLADEHDVGLGNIH